MAKKKKLKAFWERAYQGHAYWEGKEKLGKVTLAGKNVYTWVAAGKAGAAESLEKAKAAVEYAVLVAGKQRDLFND